MGGNQLSPAETLTVALTALESFRGDVRHADTTAANMSLFHVGAAGVITAQTGTLMRVPQCGPATACAAVLLLVAFACGFLVAGHHLAAAVGSSAQGASRTGWVRAGHPLAADPHALAQEMWSTIAALSETVHAKRARVRRAMPWTATMLMSATLWTALGALTG